MARFRDCLEAAVARDPDYGEAWAWLAFSYLFEYESGYNPRPELYNALDRALEAGQRAVELDPNNAIVHANLSYVRFLRHEVDASLASAERALVLNPNDPAVLCQAGIPGRAREGRGHVAPTATEGTKLSYHMTFCRVENFAAASGR